MFRVSFCFLKLNFIKKKGKGKKMSNPFKKQLAKSFVEGERKKEETTRKILSFFEKRGELTEEEKKEFLEIDEETILNDIYRMLYYVAKRNIETGEIIDFETYKENYMKEQKILLEQIPEKWQKAPEEGESEEEVEK